jgi:hypothetical protein
MATDIWTSFTAEVVPAIKADQKNWTMPVYKKIAENGRRSLDDPSIARTEAYEGKLAGAWLQALPSSNLGLKMSDNKLRISVALRLGAKICEPHTCICGEPVSSNGRHGLSCRKSAGRFARHSQLNDIIKRSLASVNVPSILEPPGLSRTDGKRPDGLTTVSWSRGRSMIWDATVVDALCPGLRRSSHLIGLRRSSHLKQQKMQRRRRRRSTCNWSKEATYSSLLPSKSKEVAVQTPTGS